MYIVLSYVVIKSRLRCSSITNCMAEAFEAQPIVNFLLLCVIFLFYNSFRY